MNEGDDWVTALDELAERGVIRSVDAGDTLVVEGEEGDAVFVVRSGSLVVEVSRPEGGVAEMGVRSAGDLLGELSSMAGGRRLATLRAIDEVVVSELDPATVRSYLGANPELADQISRTARNRLDRTALVRTLAPIVGEDHHDVIPDLVEHMTIVDLRAGEVLFRQGEASDAAYIVLSGRLLAAGIDLAGVPFDREMGRGEVVGEIGLIDAAPRAGTVHALRGTVLARIALPAFQAAMVRHPTLMLRLFRAILVRASRPVVRRSGVATIAVSVTASTDRRHVNTQLWNEIERHGSTQLVSAGRVDAELGVNGLADSPLQQPGAGRVADMLHELEVTNDHVIYEIDPSFPRWSERVIQQADRLLIVTSADPDEAEQARVRELLELSRVAERSTTWIAHLHPRDTERPTSWLEADSAAIDLSLIDEVHHARDRSKNDLARVARLTSGHGVGLVLGGGGARGFAHIGAVRALREAGIPIDRVGGASIGSTMAAAVAMDWDDSEFFRRVKIAFDKPLDYTVPIVALTKGERIRAALEAHVGGWDAAHTWVPFFCISTNLTHASVVVHREGDMPTAIRASLAIPGVIPPVPMGDDLLVDGGVLNNLPIDVLANDPSIERVIAVDVAPPVGPRAKTDYGLSVSGWSALTKKLRGGKDFPALSAVLMRALLIGSSRDRAAFLEAGMADLYLDLDLRGTGLLDFTSIESGEAAGYDQSVARIKEWVATTCFS